MNLLSSRQLSKIIGVSQASLMKKAGLALFGLFHLGYRNVLTT